MCIEDAESAVQLLALIPLMQRMPPSLLMALSRFFKTYSDPAKGVKQLDTIIYASEIYLTRT